jgi:hypothetical protein
LRGQGRHVDKEGWLFAGLYVDVFVVFADDRSDIGISLDVAKIDCRSAPVVGG